jgi:hypothetical protein
MGWSFFGNLDPVSMPVPVRPGNYSSPWFTTRINDLYELDLGTAPWRQNPVDLTWQIIDASGNILATGNWHDKTSGTHSIILARYRPKPGLRQRVLINIPHDVAGSEPVPTLSLYCPEASLNFSYEAPVAILWAIFFLGLAVFFVIARDRIRSALLPPCPPRTFLTFTFQRSMTNLPFSRKIKSFVLGPW